jgi:hypothetical protein
MTTIDLPRTSLQVLSDELRTARETMRAMATVQRRLEQREKYWREKAGHWKHLTLGYERELGIRGRRDRCA